jgi:biopolymer transport protein ExbB/TolQ
MNRINPLYVGPLLVVILLILFFKLSTLKEELRELKHSYKESEHLAQNLARLKKLYATQDKTKRSLKRILSQSSLKSANIEQKSSKKSLNISAKKMDAKALNSLMSKILNGSYQVAYLDIKKLNESEVSFEMEIKW